MNTQLLGPIARALMPPEWLEESSKSQLQDHPSAVTTPRDRVRAGLIQSRNRILHESRGQIELLPIPKGSTCDDYDLAKAALNMARLLLASEASLRGNEYFESLLSSTCIGQVQ